MYTIRERGAPGLPADTAGVRLMSQGARVLGRCLLQSGNCVRSRLFGKVRRRRGSRWYINVITVYAKTAMVAMRHAGLPS